jgi:hypothetical protein
MILYSHADVNQYVEAKSKNNYILLGDNVSENYVY